MKVFTMYEGWDAEKEKQGRSTLVEKTMLAGMEKSTQFHEKREACIRKKYNADEIGQRILNRDGGSRIKEPYDADVIFQSDRYHIYQEILRKIRDKEAQETIRELFDNEKTDEMLKYIQIYADSVENPDEKDKTSQKARELYQYLNNNRDGLLPYDKRGVTIPEPKEGVVYKGMGIQETQNYTVITLRMKHRRMRWSVKGANNLAKALYRKENKVYRRIDIYNTDAEDRGNVKRCKIAQKRWKRESICRSSKSPYADHRGNADSIKESI